LTVGKTLTDFATTYPTEAGGLAPAITAISTTGIAYTLSAQLEASANNTMQGRQAVIDFNWKILQ
jgi:hypothetical protein